MRGSAQESDRATTNAARGTNAPSANATGRPPGSLLPVRDEQGDRAYAACGGGDERVLQPPRHAFAMELPDRLCAKDGKNGPRRDALEQVVVVLAVREREDGGRRIAQHQRKRAGPGPAKAAFVVAHRPMSAGMRPRQDDIGNIGTRSTTTARGDSPGSAGRSSAPSRAAGFRDGGR